MVAYGGGGRLMFIAPLIAVLGVIAMLPFSNCGKSPTDPYVVYPACPEDFSQDLKNVTFYSSYLNINPLIHKEPDLGFHVSLSKNILSDGTYDGSTTAVKFIAEVHPPYIAGIDPYKYAQLVVYEYLSNSKTFYITLHTILGDTHQDGGFQHEDDFFFYRINCDEINPNHYEEILYNNLFSESDTMLGLSKCFPDVNGMSAFQYGENRKNFVEDAYQEACMNRGPGVPSKGLPPFDCYGMLTAIKDMPGSSYNDVMYANGQRDKPDPFTFTCPHLSAFAPWSDRLATFAIKEYYADAVHPLLSFKVTYFSIDVHTLELKAEVYSTGSLLTTGKNGLCPQDRMVHNDYSAKKIKLTSCDRQPIYKFMADIDLDNKVAVTAYKAITISDGVVNDKAIFKNDPSMYHDVRDNFTGVWQSICHVKKLFG